MSLGLLGIIASQPLSVASGPPVFGALVVLDFFNDVYTVAGVSVPYTDLIDANSFFGPLDASKIVAGVGLKSPVEGGFIGAALADIIAGASLRFDLVISGGGVPRLEMQVFDDPAFTSGLTIDVSETVGHIADFDDIIPTDLLVLGTDTVNVTFTPTNLAMAVNGTSTVAKANPRIDAAANAAGFVLFGASGACTCTKISIYLPVSDADLPTLPLPASGVTMVAAAGAFVLSGSTTTLRRIRKLVAGAGSFALTGTDVALIKSGTFVLLAGAGSFALVGADVTLKHNVTIVAGSDSFALNGTVVTLRRSLPLVAGAGSFTVSGTTATLKHGLQVVAGSGSFVLTGTTATLTKIAVGILDGLSFSGAWSPSRLLISTYAGAKETNSSGFYDSWLDQTGNSRPISESTTARPAVSSGGPNSVSCGDFDGTNDRLNSGIAVSNFLSASAGYGIVSFIPDTISGSDATNAYNNTPVWGDAGGELGVYLRAAIAQAYNWDGNSDEAEHAITIGSTVVVEWWHDASNVYICVNNGTPISQPSGNTTDVTNSLQLGKAYIGSAAYFDGKIFELALAPSVPATRSAIAANFMAYVGANTYMLPADAGSFALNGTAATLTIGQSIVADSGSFALTGAAATLTHTGVLWTPATFGSSIVKLWFDGSDGASITQVANAISQWNDKSGNGNHITQSTGGNKPTLVAAEQNGLSIVRFDGGDNMSKTSSLTGVPANTQTTFLVVKPTSATTGFVYWTTNGATIAGTVRSGTGNNQYQGSSNNVATYDPDTNWHVLSGYIILSKRQIYEDGTSKSTDSNTDSSASVPTQIWFGSDSNPLTFFTGDLGEFVQCTGTLSDADRQIVEGYLAWKWGLQANLPGGHPYVSGPPFV